MLTTQLASRNSQPWDDLQAKSLEGGRASRDGWMGNLALVHLPHFQTLGPSIEQQSETLLPTSFCSNAHGPRALYTSQKQFYPILISMT